MLCYKTTELSESKTDLKRDVLLFEMLTPWICENVVFLKGSITTRTADERSTVLDASSNHLHQNLNKNLDNATVFGGISV